MESFDDLWEWWVTLAPGNYLKFVDKYLFVDNPASTQNCEAQEDVQMCWKRNKIAFTSSFVMKHWLLLVIQSMHDVVHLKPPLHQIRYWEPSILKHLKQPFTFITDKTVFCANVNMPVIGLFNVATSIYAPLNPHFFPKDGVYRKIDFCSDVDFEILFQKTFRVRCSRQFAWSATNNTGKVCRTFPIINHLIYCLKLELQHLLVAYLPVVLCDVILMSLNLNFEQPVSEWFWTSIADYMKLPEKRTLGSVKRKISAITSECILA